MRITSIRHKPKISKGGKFYISLSMKTDVHGDKYITGFGNKKTVKWQRGDELPPEAKVVESGNYLNLEMETEKADTIWPDQYPATCEFVMEALKSVGGGSAPAAAQSTSSAPVPPPPEDIDPEDIPF